MIDLNPHVKALLEQTGIEVKQGAVFEFTSKPLITFRKVTTDQGFHADNIEQSQISKFAVDIWSTSPVKNSNIGIKVNELMQTDGWTRTYDYDVPRQTPEELFHTSMRFTKEAYF